MRARHRHINPIAANATYAWDTRYDTDSMTNNGAIGTWTDRGGNAATQVTSANRPVWKTNDIGGQPSVTFDGSNDSLVTSSVTSVTGVSVIAVGKRPWTTSKFAPVVASNYGIGAGIAFLHAGSGFFDWAANDFLWFGNGYNTGRAPRGIGPITAYSNGTVVVMSGVLSSSTARAWHSGARVSTRVESAGSVPSTAATLNVGGTAGTSDYGDFSFGHISYWRNTAISDSLRQRLQHAVAYSFKVACN